MWIVLAFASTTAEAVVPRIVGDPIVDNPSFDGVVNTMMYTVTVTVDGTGSDADHTAMVGFAPESDYVGCNDTAWKWSHAETFDTTDTRSWTLYNFVPGTTYYYRVRVGSGAAARSRCGVLETTAAPTPTLPEALGYLQIRYAKSGDPFDTQYVLVETDDCGGSGGMIGGATNYLVVLDAVNEAIVWYLDISAAAGLLGGSSSGFRYYQGATAAEDTILAQISHRYVYEWGFNGTTRNSYDFGNPACSGAGAEGPCLHHDIAKSPETGNTYVLSGMLSPTTTEGTVWEEACGTGSRFIDDGFHVFDGTFTETGQLYLMADAGFDPAVDPGPLGERAADRPNACRSDVWDRLLDAPDGLTDWVHTNSVAPWTVGDDEVIDVSSKEWNQVFRFDAATGALLWRLSSRRSDSDWGTLSVASGIVGDATFSDQHDVHGVAPNTLMMLDNQGDSDGARALQIRLNTRPRSAVIEKSWAVVSGSGGQLRCSTEGTAQMVPGSDHAFVMCAGLTVAVELDDPSGNSGDPPPLAISLPDGDPEEFCSVGGPAERNMIRGWRRAFPMERVGEF